MNESKFPKEIHDALGYYVYRLIDPRDGSTFYIGKGIGDRLFQHVAMSEKLEANQDQYSEKHKTILGIRNAGLEPIHIVHRHGLTEREAYQVEAALIDATPGLTNEQGGHGSADFGPAHASELVRRYQLDEFEPQHRLLVIKLSRSLENRSLKDAVRAAWRISVERAESADFVLGVVNGVCVVVLQAKGKKWIPATKANFAFLDEDKEHRHGFEAVDVSDHVARLYLGKKLPEAFRAKKGAAQPFLYINC
jgi:uncharacterized protein